jgi:hypothetical protein
MTMTGTVMPAVSQKRACQPNLSRRGLLPFTNTEKEKEKEMHSYPWPNVTQMRSDIPQRTLAE